jgi:hypothetical protein
MAGIALKLPASLVQASSRMIRDCAMTEVDKHYYEVASEGGVVVLGEMTQQEAEGLARGYADLWQCATQLIRVPFLHVDDHRPWADEDVQQIAQFVFRSLTDEERQKVLYQLEPWRRRPKVPEPRDPETIDAEEAEQLRAFYEALDLGRLREAIGRVVLARMAAFDAATPEASEKEAMGVIDLRSWLEQDLSADEMKLLAAATGNPTPRIDGP